ncbi:type IV toxin-antitoxin system AbiEi family antitoxin domain-containing protein [Lactococcus kimchii]|uniref:type IV toxin-antitoxin system AbiEi family antitoxin domain-containing protein n=1 Tax=Lactococcus sp. S-13 TaxID=2507158 RepID=UPI001022CCD4|nr:type IV toxin-antitoxin system AbiEi family antitoxin domain-containing protein [Lactococcus sp. S-13]RZI48198.1 abortive phage infection protein [Lactococcus sp. S-13]
MSKSDLVLSKARENNGTITTAMVQSEGIARQYLTNLVNQGLLEKSTRGVYVLPTVWEDEFINVQAQFKKGIFSKETALFLHDLTDRTPLAYSMTFPDGYNLSKVKADGIIANRSIEQFYGLGIETVKSPSGNLVRVYNAEKTLCDILRPRSGVETGVIAEAFKRYVTKPSKNIPLLSDYAKILKVEEKVRSYLEVLL